MNVQGKCLGYEGSSLHVLFSKEERHACQEKTEVATIERGTPAV